MEFKNRKNHYLHPDFEDKDSNTEKKQSPLALLAQTCKNIGSVTDLKEVSSSDRTMSPNSTMIGFRKLTKRSCSDSSSNSSSTDRYHQSQVKRIHYENKIAKKTKLSVVELKSEDSSSEKSSKSDVSLMANLFQFVKHVNTGHMVNDDKRELLNLLALQCKRGRKNDSSTSNEVLKKGDQFNVEKGYHLETAEERRSQTLGCNSVTSSKVHNSGIGSPVLGETTSTIKYCMYCGKLIPVLTMLLAHIRLEHGNNNTFLEPEWHGTFPPPLPTNENLSSINPFITSTSSKTNQTFSFLSDYLSSSFQGLHNLIC